MITLKDFQDGDKKNFEVIACFSLVQYKKPKEILNLEQELLKELKKLKGTSEGDVDCKTQWILNVGPWETLCVAFKAEP